MPSFFEQQLAANLPGLYAVFGIAGTYIAPDKSITPVAIRVHRHEMMEIPRDNRAAGERQTGDVMVQQSQVTKVVREGRFEIEGVEVWTCLTTPVLKNGEFICTCQRSGVERLAPRGHKGS